nr:MAG TPA: tail protein [Caudoviricetes sp.]
MSLQNLTLVTNKKLTNLQDAVIRQSEKGLTITAVFLNEDSSPYDLTNKKVTFNEHKESDKYVVDTNVQITDERNGAISYTLHPQCYAATGEAWFEIADASGTVVDSTQNFNLKVKDAANASIYNTNYITQLDALRDQMQALVDNADGQLKQQLKTTQDQMDQKLTELGNAYQIAEQGRATAYKQAEANRDSGWSQDKQRIDNEWNQDKDRINGEWTSQKQSIQNTANSQQSSISSQWSQLKSNADSQLATIQSNINALQATIDDINKNKVPGLSSSLQDAQNKLDKILSNLHGFVVSSNDVDQAVSKGIANITGNLIDPNLNDWVKNDAASKANININYQDGTNDISFTGVENSEILDFKFNTKQNTDYILTFTYTPDDIHTVRSNCVFLALWYEDLKKYYGEWRTDYNPKVKNQVIRVPAQQGGNYSLKVNSQNLTEMHIGISFDNFIDSQTSKFKISNLVVRETNSTLVGLTDTISSLPKTVQGVKPDGNGNINLPNQNVAFSFDSSTGEPNMRMVPYLNYYPVDQTAIKDILKNQLPAKYALKSDDAMKIPVVNGEANDDLTSFRNMCQLRIYDGNGQNVKNVPFQHKSFTVLVNMYSNWGTLTYWGQDGRVYFSACNGNTWTAWTQIANSSDFANYYSKSEIDTKTSDLQIQSDASASNLRMRCDNLETRCKNLESRCSNLETQLNVLQGQMADLLGAISISGDTLQIDKKLAVRGNITTYWDGADQFIVYSGHNARRGYFGMYDNGSFKVNG